MTRTRNTQHTNGSHTSNDMFGDMLADLMELLMQLVWSLLIAVAVTAWWAVLFPMISIPIGLAATAWLLVGWWAGVAVAGVSAAGIMLWRWKRPQMFERLVTQRARTRFLTWWRYRRRWTTLLDACHLTIRESGVLVACPPLRKVDIGDATDRVQAKMLAGQCPADYENRTAALAHAFGALDCRATIIGPGTVELLFRHRDALAEPIALPHQPKSLPGNSTWNQNGKEAV
ncbi:MULTISPECIES: hypothetical protein [unclassified Nocardia]|uniref:hypothetical protein n=1 Tax=unclassified Nocardia TaxID=2637762 RepID=UPI001CE48D1D|nr:MULTISPECIES: hypothetical protein [unclassified Nocardia]